MLFGIFGGDQPPPPPDELLGVSPLALGVGPGTDGLTWWKFMASVMLPIPIALVVVLSAPCPRNLRQGVLWLVNEILVAKVRGPIQVIHSALLVCGLSVASSIGPMLAARAEFRALDTRRDPNILVMLLARQYRAERNFWLSLFALSSWSALWVIFQVNREKHILRGKLLALQGKEGAAVEEVSVLGENLAGEMKEIAHAVTKPEGPAPERIDALAKKDM